MNKHTSRATALIAKWTKGNRMDKNTVRKLRARRDLLKTERAAIEAELRRSHPLVMQYLDTTSLSDTAQQAYSTAWAGLRQEQREELIPEFWPSARLQLPKGKPMPKHRDMSWKEFEAALERRGFRDVRHGIKISHNATIGPVLRWNKNAKEYVVDRRETLKRAIVGAAKEKGSK